MHQALVLARALLQRPPPHRDVKLSRKWRQIPLVTQMRHAGCDAASIHFTYCRKDDELERFPIERFSHRS
jgi:hypothetical protein